MTRLAPLPTTVQLHIDWNAAPAPFRHTWTGVVNIDQFRWMVRRDTQDQLKMAARELGGRHVRAVGMLDDEMRFFTLTPADWREKKRQPRFNFQVIDYVVDSLQDIGLAPMITTCFMPSSLAAGTKTVFTTKGNISLPADWTAWDGAVRETVGHCVERYGLDTVCQWYFEVWNEPNLQDSFFDGDFDDFLRLWKATYAAIKAVDSRLRVGGPSTARAEWLPEFLAWTREHGCEPDYIILHVYNNDSQFAALSPFDGPQEDRTAKSPNYAAGVINGARKILDAAGYQGEVHWNEWGRTWHPTDPLRETAVEAAWIVKTMAEVSQLADYFAYWCLSDIYDQVGYVSTPFEHHYGMLNVHGLRKPSWHAHQMLCRLSKERRSARLEGAGEGTGAIVTGGREGGAILLFASAEGATRHEVELSFPPELAGRRLTLTALSNHENNVVARWAEMGSPAHPTRKQMAELQAGNLLLASHLHPEVREGGGAVVAFEAPGLLLIEW